MSMSETPDILQELYKQPISPDYCPTPKDEYGIPYEWYDEDELLAGGYTKREVRRMMKEKERYG